MSIYIGDKEIKNLFVGGSTSVSDMQGPCPNGFHIPLESEITSLFNMMASLSLNTRDNRKIYLKFPLTGYLTPDNGRNPTTGSAFGFWSSNVSGNYNGKCIWCEGNVLNSSVAKGYATSIRPFKNSVINPISSGSTLKSGWVWLYHSGSNSYGIAHNSSDGIMSISSDGTTWVTIADKNLGATQVYNNGDALSVANCGYLYQRGNNYGFSYTGASVGSTSQVNASAYGPGNYYSSNIFIGTTYSQSYNWESSFNANLRGGVTQGTTEKGAAKAVYLGENKVRPSAPFTPGANTIYYFPLDTDATDHSGNGYTLSNTGTATTIGRNFTATVNTSPAGSTISNPAFRMAWVKVNNVGYEYHKVNSMGMNVSDGLAIHFMNGWVGSSQPILINFDYVSGSSYSSSSWQPGITTGNWYCIAFQKEGTDTVAYCNGVRHVMASGKTGYYWGAPSYLARESSASSGFSVDLSEIIMESATWTSTKVIDYFNATKSKYGVS